MIVIFYFRVSGICRWMINSPDSGGVEPKVEATIETLNEDDAGAEPVESAARAAAASDARQSVGECAAVKRQVDDECRAFGPPTRRPADLPVAGEPGLVRHSAANAHRI